MPEATAGNVPVPSGGSLKSIRTPHQPAHSHPGESPRFSQTMTHCAQLSLYSQTSETSWHSPIWNFSIRRDGHVAHGHRHLGRDGLKAHLLLNLLLNVPLTPPRACDHVFSNTMQPCFLWHGAGGRQHAATWRQADVRRLQQLGPVVWGLVKVSALETLVAAGTSARRGARPSASHRLVGRSVQGARLQGPRCILTLLLLPNKRPPRFVTTRIIEESMAGDAELYYVHSGKCAFDCWPVRTAWFLRDVWRQTHLLLFSGCLVAARTGADSVG